MCVIKTICALKCVELENYDNFHMNGGIDIVDGRGGGHLRPRRAGRDSWDTDDVIFTLSLTTTTPEPPFITDKSNSTARPCESRQICRDICRRCTVFIANA